MRRHLIALTVVTVLVIAGCSGGDGRTDRPSTTTTGSSSGKGAGSKAVKAALVTYDDCEPLLRHIRTAAAERVGPGGFSDGWGVGGDARAMSDGDVATARPAAPDASGAMEDSAKSAEPQEGTDFSGTNVQEKGVDEPDVVKTDGTTMFVVRGTELISVAVGGSADGTAGVLGRVRVDEDGDGYANELLLSGDRAFVLSTSWDQGMRQGDGDVVPPAATTDKIAPTEPGTGGPITTLTSVDVSDPADLRVTDTVTVEGEYRTARMVDGVARVVLQSPGPDVPWAYPATDSSGATEKATEDNQRLIEKTTLDDWLPHRIDTTTGERTDLVGCGDVYAPASFAGSGLVTVLTVPLAGTGPVEPKAATVLASADTVYASATSLYVAAHAWPDFRTMQRDVMPPQDEGTDLHRFDITGDVAVHAASGRVDGYVLNQFALSEHDDRLRVATTTTPPWTGNGEEERAPTSSVTVFEQNDATLTAIGTVGDLGKGETIRSVRFVGDTAYVVTFRQTDPFYVVDLSDPTAPRVAGELKLPGYSGYLHPVDATHVLGVGQEGDADGRITGVKVSLFDVSDPSAPVESAHWTQENGSQQVEFDAKAFLYWPATKLAVVPVQVYDVNELREDGDGGQNGFNGAVGLTVDGAAITELGRLSHAGQGVPVYEATVERSIVVGDVLWTLSSVGLLASDLQTLTPGAFVAF